MSTPATALPPTPARAPRWDVFCRVIDNHGDLGVCWRLAADLARRGVVVRLWVDDASALAWMAPHGAPGVTVHAWPDEAARIEPGEVVIEAFGCDPPRGFVEGMRAASCPPVWINLEYLSAEAYVERAHRLPSPQMAGPGAGMVKWFFYPGFSAATGGLLREPGLLDQRDARQAPAPKPDLAALSAPETPRAELTLSLFCYRPAALPSLLDALMRWPDARRPGALRTTHLMVTAGLPTEQVRAYLGLRDEPTVGQPSVHGGLTVSCLPYLDHPAFDRLLWDCDANLVRGEDSLVRAIWAARPMLWQVYPQDDGAHEAKLDAFLRQQAAGVDAQRAAPAARLAQAWNGLSAPPSPADWHAWFEQVTATGARQAAQSFSARLATLPDLTTALMRFAQRTAGGAGLGEPGPASS
ncbi:MAG: elongation factor P maturation arginine rhamnosyltransferase EarP [Leptothrix sp. (in: b-proteobacteria)]